MQITKPFKQRGVANVATIFELSDGQTISIFFHNPDVMPQKIAPSDEVISWKWLLNKKDITIVVAPERGTDLNVRDVARRIVRLAEKNSPAFQRVNATRSARLQNIQALKDEIVGLEKDLETTQHELEVAKVAAEDARNRKAQQAAATTPATEPASNQAPEQQTASPTENAPDKPKKRVPWWDTKTGEKYDAIYRIGKSRGKDYVGLIHTSGNTYDASVTMLGMRQERRMPPEVIVEWLRTSVFKTLSSDATEKVLTIEELRAKLTLVKGTDILFGKTQPTTDQQTTSPVEQVQQVAPTVGNDASQVTQENASESVTNNLSPETQQQPPQESQAQQEQPLVPVQEQQVAPVAQTQTNTEPQDLLGTAPKVAEQAAHTERERLAEQAKQQRDVAPDAKEFALEMTDARTGRGVHPGQSELALTPSTYIFGTASGAFKNWIFALVDLGNSAPLETARAMDQAARSNGGSIFWDFFDGTFDSVHYIRGAVFDSGEIDALESMGVGRVLDSAVLSKDASDSLIKRGYVERDQNTGYQSLTKEGRAVVDALESEDENYFDPDDEWENLPSLGEDEQDAITLDGDFAGHPFRGNQHLKANQSSGAAVTASRRAKWHENSGNTKNAKRAHKAAYHAHSAALESDNITNVSRNYHRVMAKFHAQRAGVKATFDSAILDAVAELKYVGQIKKQGQMLGRVFMGIDGTAIVYVGASGSTPVRNTNDRPFEPSTTDGAAMVKALFVVQDVPSEIVLPESSDTESNPQENADIAFFKSVIDKTVPNILAPELSKEIEVVYRRNEDLPPLVDLFDLAVNSYKSAIVDATTYLE
jgi:hypothetical protein